MSTLCRAIRRRIVEVIRGIISLIIPYRCAVCGKEMQDYEDFICVDCLLTMPRTQFHTLPNNPMAERMRSLSPSIEHAAALFYFHNKSHWRTFIHHIKYHNAWHYAYKMGYHYGIELSKVEHFASIDVVIPVPLHPFRRIKRGYNQSEYIALGIARALDKKVVTKALRRVRNNSSQTRHNSEERWVNVESLFKLRKGSLPDGVHILLIDDLFTTGATVSSCAEAITQQLSNAKISIVTLALSHRHFKFNA